MNKVIVTLYIDETEEGRIADGVSALLTEQMQSFEPNSCLIDWHYSELPAKGWQPIETAPRDGTPILICGHFVQNAEHQVSQAIYHDKDGWQWWFFDPPRACSEFDRDDMINAVKDDEHGPTHWIPIPTN